MGMFLAIFIGAQFQMQEVNMEETNAGDDAEFYCQG